MSNTNIYSSQPDTSSYYPNSVNYSGPTPLPPSHLPPTGKRKARKRNLVIATILVLVIIVAGTLFYLKMDKNIDISFKQGVTTNWSITLPESQDYRYVKKFDEDTLILFSQATTSKADQIKLSSKTHKPKSDLVPITDLPSCINKAGQAYTVKSGKISCNSSGVKTIATNDIKGLNQNEKKNLGDSVKVALSDDDVSIAYTDKPTGPNYVIAVNPKSELIWVRNFPKKITVTADKNQIWVVEESHLTELVPTTEKSARVANQKAREVLKAKPKIHFDSELCTDGADRWCVKFPKAYHASQGMLTPTDGLKLEVSDSQNQVVFRLAAWSWGRTFFPDEVGTKSSTVVNVYDTNITGLKLVCRGNGNLADTLDKAKIIRYISEYEGRYYPYQSLTVDKLTAKVGHYDHKFLNRACASGDDIYDYGISAPYEKNPPNGYATFEEAKAAFKQPVYDVGLAIMQTLYRK